MKDISDQPQTLKLNKLKFRRVIDNLITNALKFTEAGGYIRVYSHADHSIVNITVSDTGIGIPDDLQPVIFDRFTKAGRHGLDGEVSTGLGMSIVKQIVDLHQGTISLTSDEHQGTKFVMSIPID